MTRSWVPVCSILALLVASAGQGTRAQERLPDGVVVGPWILVPVVETRWGQDSNPFYVTSDAGAPDNAAESSSRIAAGLAAVLPFRSSQFRLGYRREKLDYERTELRKDTTDEFGAEMLFRFPTLDEASIRLDYVDGASDTGRFDPGGETLFRGDPYTFFTAEVEVSRSVLSTRGYSVRILREDLAFPEADDPGFFAYTGWSARVEHREPIGSTAWIVASYAGRRYDHTCTGIAPSGEPCPPDGVPFRVENSDSIFLGLRGSLAGRSPYLITAGYADLRYDGGGEPGYQGPVGEGNIRMPLGSQGFVEGTLYRRPYSSFYLENNYYVQAGAAVRVGFDRPDRWGIAAAVLFSNSRYPANDPELGIPRRDATWRMEAYANLYLPRHFGLRIGVTDENRDSNVAGLSYDRRTLAVGAFFGWL